MVNLIDKTLGQLITEAKELSKEAMGARFLPKSKSKAIIEAYSRYCREIKQRGAWAYYCEYSKLSFDHSADLLAIQFC